MLIEDNQVVRGGPHPCRRRDPDGRPEQARPRCLRGCGPTPARVDVYTSSEYSQKMTIPIALLGLLEHESSHGYELKRDYDAYFGRSRPLPFGQVYATLARLARDGKVVVGEAEPGAGPDRKRYVITEQGVSDVDTWLREPVEPERHLQTVLFTKVVLALMSGRPAEEYLDAQRSRHLRRMHELIQVKQGGELIDGLLADHGLFHLEADLRWIELTSARLDALAAHVGTGQRLGEAPPVGPV